MGPKIIKRVHINQVLKNSNVQNFQLNSYLAGIKMLVHVIKVWTHSKMLAGYIFLLFGSISHVVK